MKPFIAFAAALLVATSATAANDVTIETTFKYGGHVLPFGDSVELALELQPTSKGSAAEFERPFFDLLGTLQFATMALEPEDYRSNFGFFCQFPKSCSGTVFSTVTHSIEKVKLGYTTASTNSMEKPFEDVWVYDDVDGSSLKYAAVSLGGLPYLPSTNYKLTETHTYGYGTWDFVLVDPLIHVSSGKLNLTQSYTPYSISRYIADGVQSSKLANTTDPRQIADEGQQYVQLLRQTSAATSSKNLNLRDAEYAFYGYGSGANFNNYNVLSPTAWKTSPIGLSIYNGLKDMSRSENPFASKFAAVAMYALGKVKTNDSGLPGTTDAEQGVRANSKAFQHGYNGGTIENLASCVGENLNCSTGFSSQNRESKRIQSKLSAQPKTATASLTEENGGTFSLYVFEQTEFDTAFFLRANQFNFISVVGGEVTQFALEGEQSLSFDLLALEGNEYKLFRLTSNEVYDLAALGLYNQVAFGLLPTSPEEWFGDYMLNLKLASQTQRLIQTYSLRTDITPVPEPGVAYLFLASLAVLLARRRAGRSMISLTPSGQYRAVA